MARVLTDRCGAPGAVALAQGMYFTATGVWPLVHMPSFLAVTGPKRDRWLVRTVGALVGVVGGVLTSAARRDRVTPELTALGAGSALALALVDVVYTSRRTIPPIYRLDAAAEATLLAAWAGSSMRRARQS